MDNILLISLSLSEEYNARVSKFGKSFHEYMRAWQNVDFNLCHTAKSTRVYSGLAKNIAIVSEAAIYLPDPRYLVIKAYFLNI
jgi:hypothetical protein